MKEIFEITFKVQGIKQFKPHYMNGERTFKVSAPRGRLFQTLDSMEKKLIQKYKVDDSFITNEDKPLTN